jgi:hypothetical protein
VLTEQRPRMQIAARSRASSPRRCCGLRGASSPSSGNARNLSGEPSPWRKPATFGAKAYRWHHLSRC